MASHHAMPLDQALRQSLRAEGVTPRAVPFNAGDPNCWHETPEAKALLEKVDAFERLSDHWADVPEAARGFGDAAQEAENELDALRYDAVDAAANAQSSVRDSDEWRDAWEEADSDAPPVEQAMREARRAHAGDEFLTARGYV